MWCEVKDHICGDVTVCYGHLYEGYWREMSHTTSLSISNHLIGDAVWVTLITNTFAKKMLVYSESDQFDYRFQALCLECDQFCHRSQALCLESDNALYISGFVI